MTPQPTTRPPYPLLFLFLFLATAIAGLAYHHHLAQREAIAHEVQTQLLAIADMKVKDILAWRDEKQGQARMILNSRLTLEGIHRVVRGGSAHEQESVGNWMESLCRELHFGGATLTNLRGDVVLARGRRFGGALHIRELALQVARTADVSLTDFHLDDAGAPPHLGLNVPLRLAPGAPVFGTLLIG